MTTALHYFALLVLMTNMASGQTDSEGYEFQKTEVATSSPQTYAATFDVPTRSKLDCAKTCAEDVTCSAFGYSKSRKVCYGFNNTLNKNLSVDISTEIVAVTFYNMNFCENDGKRLGPDCVCSGGYVGLRCERLMTDCSEGYSEGIFETGVYQIQPEAASYPFQVKCVMENQGETIIQRHHNFSFNFNRTWEEFRTGFGDRDEDHWLGNDKLFWLTNSRNFSLKITIKSKSRGFYEFDILKFIVHSENMMYAISVYESPDSESCLARYNGTAFSTFDTLNSPNCAALNGSGWWYNSNCSGCNLNGRLYKENTTLIGPAVWNTPTNISRIVETQMALVLQDDTSYDTTHDPSTGFTTPAPLPTTGYPQG